MVDPLSSANLEETSCVVGVDDLEQSWECQTRNSTYRSLDAVQEFNRYSFRYLACRSRSVDASPGEQVDSVNAIP